MDKLIDPLIQKYQGPALLAYNNAVFTDEDFDNLSNLGDSRKLEDGLTTGKFGRGFNSVSNIQREDDLC
jgi:sacsin